MIFSSINNFKRKFYIFLGLFIYFAENSNGFSFESKEEKPYENTALFFLANKILCE